jgi:hypothetical protein
MAKRGRKRKEGDRYASGKLRPVHDKGGEWVQKRRDRFGTYYSTAIGRAYVSGLLGDIAEAKDRLDGASRFVRTYQRHLGGEGYRCPLDDTPRGLRIVDLEVTEQQTHDHDWLLKVIDAMDVAGCRPWLDQLIHRAHTDMGPPWLERLLDGGKHPADQMILKAALRALDIVAPPRRAMRILVA